MKGIFWWSPLAAMSFTSQSAVEAYDLDSFQLNVNSRCCRSITGTHLIYEPDGSQEMARSCLAM